MMAACPECLSMLWGEMGEGKKIWGGLCREEIKKRSLIGFATQGDSYKPNGGAAEASGAKLNLTQVAIASPPAAC